MKKLLLLNVLLLSSTAWAGSVHDMEVEPIKTEILVKSDTSWDGTPLPEYTKSKPEVTVMKITIPPGVSMLMHKHPAISAGMILSGELTVTTQDHKVIQVKAGDGLVEVVNKWHTSKNEGKQPTVILAVFFGEKGEPLTINQPATAK